MSTGTHSRVVTHVASQKPIMMDRCTSTTRVECAPLKYELNFIRHYYIDNTQEPERARDAHGALSPNYAFDTDLLNPSSGTQKSAFFPWDNAAGTSSSVGAPFASIAGKGSDRLSLDQADIRLHRPQSRSDSRRGSIFTTPGQGGSALDASFSPGSGNRLSLVGGEDFQFEGK